MARAAAPSPPLCELCVLIFSLVPGMGAGVGNCARSKWAAGFDHMTSPPSHALIGLDSLESSTDSARARFDPPSGTHLAPTHPFHTYADHHAWSSTKMFGFILGLAVGPRAALSRDERSRQTTLYSLALLLISRPGARATFGGGSCADQDNGAVNEHNNGCSTCSSFPGACGSYDDDDFTSNDMCCACGGGVKTTVSPRTTISPTVHRPGQRRRQRAQ